MRAAGTLLALALLLGGGCAHAPAKPSAPEIELALDEGRAAERPLIPGKAFELLLRFEPKLPSYELLRMRFRLAQPGRIVFTVYGSDGNRPGKPVKVIDRVYTSSLVAGAAEGKWVVEDLGDAGRLRGAFFVGIWGPVREGDPRLWATSNSSGEVFQRELDPAALSPVPRTPILRVTVAPQP